jgi:hypothetical protein
MTHSTTRPDPLSTRREAGKNRGKWAYYLAYEADESGLPHVFAWPIDGSTPAVKVAAGMQPLWARNGEIFFVDGTSLFAIKAATQPAFAAPAPERLFERRCDWRFGFDVSGDGQRILTFFSPLKLKVVRNWLPDRMGSGEVK